MLIRRFFALVILYSDKLDPASLSYNEVFNICRDDHPDNVITSMKAIMAVLVEESDDVHEDILLTLLSSLGRNKKVST